MSNLLNDGYTQLNNLSHINADDIQTENINTKTLYINDVLFNPTGIDTSDLATLSTNQNISGSKTFSGTQVFSSIQLNSDLIVNSGGTTITNAQLQLIPNISSNTTDINALKTKTTNISYNSGTNTTSVFGLLSLPDSSINSTSINNTSFVNLTTAQSIGGVKTFTSNPVFPANSIASASINNSSFVALTGTQNVNGGKTFGNTATFSQNNTRQPPDLTVENFHWAEK